MSLCVYYCKGLDINERLLGFVDCSESQSADSLSTHILTYLKESSKAKLVEQSYDGANVMSGKFKGVQAKIRCKYAYDIYTHCMAHKVNLVVLDMCTIVKVC